MKMKHIKYEFDTEESYNAARLDIPHEIETDEQGSEIIHFTSGDIISVLNKIYTEYPTYDEAGEEITAGVISDKFHVDVLWLDEANEPDSFKPFAITLDNVGIHVFGGFDYLNQ